jgi:hypothetical protein
LSSWDTPSSCGGAQSLKINRPSAGVEVANLL